MNMKKAVLILYALGFGLSAESMAATITIDGKLTDWGLNWSDSDAANDWVPKLGIYSAVEDHITNGSYLDPGYGGQAYDAEALYVTQDDTHLYIALVTGHDPDTLQDPSKNSYSAGDFVLNFWTDTNDKSYEFGIRTPNRQDTNIGSFTTNVYQTTNENWVKDPLWGTNTPTSLDMSKLSPGDVKGQASMTILKGPDKIGLGPSSSHWIYEISVAKSIFGTVFSNTHLDVSWTMNCANDVILVEDDLPRGVDEPPMLALFALALPAVFSRRRRASKYNG